MYELNSRANCLLQTNTTTILKEYYPGMNRLMYGVVGGNYEPDKHTSALQVTGRNIIIWRRFFAKQGRGEINTKSGG